MKRSVLGKIMVCLMAMMLVLSTASFAAFAAPSKTDPVEVESAVDSEGNEVDIKVEDIPDDAIILPEGSVPGDVIDNIYLDYGDHNFEENPITITITLPGVHEGDVVDVYVDVNGIWVPLTGVAGDGYVEFIMDVNPTPNSTAAIVLLDDDTPGAPESPQTGDVDWTWPLVAVAAVAGIGIVIVLVTAKKRNDD